MTLQFKVQGQLLSKSEYANEFLNDNPHNRKSLKHRGSRKNIR